MARPIGPLARAILGRLRAGPRTAAQLAEELELPLRALVVACYNLRVAGRIRVFAEVRNGGQWRAVAVYCAASTDVSAVAAAHTSARLSRDA